MRDALRLRLELMPHLYNGAAAAHARGTSLVRPLYHEWPGHDDAYAHASQWVLGEGIVAAPVTSPLAAEAPLALGHPLALVLTPI